MYTRTNVQSISSSLKLLNKLIITSMSSVFDICFSFQFLCFLQESYISDSNWLFGFCWSIRWAVVFVLYNRGTGLDSTVKVVVCSWDSRMPEELPLFMCHNCSRMHNSFYQQIECPERKHSQETNNFSIMCSYMSKEQTVCFHVSCFQCEWKVKRNILLWLG